MFNLRSILNLVLILLLLAPGMAAAQSDLPKPGLVDADITAYPPANLTGDQAGVLAFAIQVAVGSDHTCALTADGGVKCWGDNHYGQLGDGTTANHTIPAGVSGLGSGVHAIASGLWHTCALTENGGVKCWGDNRKGQLGDGTTTNRLTPVDVSGLSDVMRAITAGVYFTCAMTEQNEAKCWGDNSSGQLGDGTGIDRTTPVDVSGLNHDVQTIISGGHHACALTAAGGVKCWGNNQHGQIGDGTTNYPLTPVEVSGLNNGIRAIAAGIWHTCAVTYGGGAKCWGRNDNGQLGDATMIERRTPVDVSGLNSGVLAIEGGVLHTCALTEGGGVKCWGNNGYAQLGNGTWNQSTTPIDVLGLTHGMGAIAAGVWHTCALTEHGGVKCWGQNEDGQLGQGTTNSHTVPADVPELTNNIHYIASGGNTDFGNYRNSHTCALTEGGGAKCWGSNWYGQLGDGTTTHSAAPIDVSGLSSGTLAITAGSSHTCALTGAGGVKCWGNNSSGQLGDGTTTARTTPIDVSGLSNGVRAVDAGEGAYESHTCALTESGGVKCWGANYFGQLGDATMIGRSTPVDVIGLSSGVRAIATGGYHTCALTEAGGVKCWGQNHYGQLGDGTDSDRNTPGEVSGLNSGVRAIVAGDWHSCALTDSGEVQCWGGDSRFLPMVVSGLSSGVLAIAAGGRHTCALTEIGGAKCWGRNESGQLGDGTTAYSAQPVDVFGLSSGVLVISGGARHTCALTTNGPVRCWGLNESGQLGINPGWTPLDVVGFGPRSALFLPLIMHR